MENNLLDINENNENNEDNEDNDYYGKQLVLPSDVYCPNQRLVDKEKWCSLYSGNINTDYSSLITLLRKRYPKLQFDHNRMYTDFANLAYQSSIQTVPSYLLHDRI